MPSPVPPRPTTRIQHVNTFSELVTTRFTRDVNAFCWSRTLPGDFSEVVTLLAAGPGINALDEARLLALPVSPAGQTAIDMLVADLRLLRDRGLSPELNCINGYPRDEEPGPVRTDVFSFHADSAPVETDTYLCTYHGAPSEGVPNEHVRRHIDIPATRAALLEEFGGEDDAAFRDYLREACYDLHYAAAPDAQPYSFGLFNLWRIAVDYPGSPVPPCIHRAPSTAPGDPPRLLLIS